MSSQKGKSVKKKFFLEPRRQMWRGRFYDFPLPSGEPATRDLISGDNLAWVPAPKGRRRRTEREQGAVLEELYQEQVQILEGAVVIRSQRKLKQTVQEWLDEKSKFRDPKTVRHYADSLSYFIEAVGDFNLTSPPAGISGTFLEHLQRTGMADTSCNSRVQGVQCFLNSCYEQDFISRPMRLEKLRPTKKEHAILSGSEMAALLRRIETRISAARSEGQRIWAANQRRAWYLLRYTGMRGGEVHSLPLDRIFPHNQTIKIADVPEANFKVKGRKEAYVPIPKQLRVFLDEDAKSRKAEEKWFLDDGTGNFQWSSPLSLARVFKSHLNEMGIRNIKPLHGFRSTVISRLLNNGVSGVIVQGLVRHKNISTTLSYFNRAKSVDYKLIENNI